MQAPSPHRESRVTLVLSWLGLALLGASLVSVPTWVETDPGVASAAARAGYHNPTAFRLILLWAGLFGGAILVLRRMGRLSALPPEDPPPGGAGSGAGSSARGRGHALELLGLALVFGVAYCPLFLGRTGPFFEDNIFLAVLHRMDAGQRPYVDFEFLYGPLLLYPAHVWMRVFGFSLGSYYTFTAISEVFQAVLLMGVLQRIDPRPRSRWLAFLVLQPFLFNTMLGVHQAGFRRLFPALILIYVCRDPRSLRVASIGGLLLALQLAYSHDYGIACLAALFGLYALLLVREGPKVIAPGVSLAALALGGWYLLARGMMGSDGLEAYLDTTRTLVARFTAGEAAFPFHWTLNSAALFGLLALAILWIARGLAGPRSIRTSTGDRLLLAATLYGFVALKSGMNRCDMWHLCTGMVPLLFSMLLPYERRLFASSALGRQGALLGIATLAATATLALVPIGRIVAEGWLRGARDTLAGRERSQAPETEAVALEWERTRPNPGVIELGAHLSGEGLRGRPVLFYDSMWSLGKQIGVPKRDPLNDNFVYSEELAEGQAHFLRDHPDALVVIRDSQWDRLRRPGGVSAATDFGPRFLESDLMRWINRLSSVHYAYVPDEMLAREERFERTVGRVVLAEFEELARVGPRVVLSRKP